MCIGVMLSSHKEQKSRLEKKASGGESGTAKRRREEPIPMKITACKKEGVRILSQPRDLKLK